MCPFGNRKVREPRQKASDTTERNSRRQPVHLLACHSVKSKDAILREYCFPVNGNSNNTKRKAGKLTNSVNLIRTENEVRHKILCKYQQINSSSPLSSIKIVRALHYIILLVSLISCQSQCLADTKGEQSWSLARAASAALYSKRPDSSSSVFAEVEDLNDSSVRTRLGTIQIEHLGNSPQDFDNLIERIVPGELQSYKNGAFQHQITAQTFDDNIGASQNKLPSLPQQGLNSKVHADANNRTTMRFFRSSKTFASIVYTNPVQDHEIKPRRLINCHLVDLEKHASDVAIYEAKYDIKTIDVEFKEMMQLIEACTNIARLRRRPINGIGQQPGAPGSQYKTSSYQQATTEVGSPGISSHHPTVVVGRPVATTAYLQQQTASQIPQTQKKQQSNGGTNAQLVAAKLQHAINGALNAELHQLKPMVEVANELDLYQPTVVFTEQHNHMGGVNIIKNNNNRPAHHHHQNRKQNQQADSGSGSSQVEQTRQVSRRRFDPYPPPKSYVNFTDSYARHLKRQINNNPVVKTLAKVGETGKRLVLGEVTAPTSGTIGRNGGATESNGGSSLRDALQEISSYDTSDLLSIWRGILPGTNWCGMGDRATSYNDLGFESDIDICCRAHDFCPVRLSAFTSGYGLFNWSFYTRSHCWCDQNFLDCLQQAESPLSTVVMKFYFGIMRTTCLNDIETSSTKNHPQQQLHQQQHHQQQQQQQQQHLSGQQNNNRQHNKQAGGGQSPSFNMANLPKAPALKQSQWLQTKYERLKQ